MSDSGLDWEYTRTEFRKALVGCGNVTNDVGLSDGLDLLADVHGCSLLMLHFRDRLSLKQQKALSDLPQPATFTITNLATTLSGTRRSPVTTSRMCSSTPESPHRSLRAFSHA